MREVTLLISSTYVRERERTKVTRDFHREVPEHVALGVDRQRVHRVAEVLVEEPRCSAAEPARDVELDQAPQHRKVLHLGSVQYHEPNSRDDCPRGEQGSDQAGSVRHDRART
jgi:hypothetical protein